MCIRDRLTPWWSTNSTALVDENQNPALNSKKMVESVEFLDKLVKEKVTPDPISSDVYTMFSSKQLAMVGAGRWVLNTCLLYTSGYNLHDFC